MTECFTHEQPSDWEDLVAACHLEPPRKKVGFAAMSAIGLQKLNDSDQQQSRHCLELHLAR